MAARLRNENPKSKLTFTQNKDKLLRGGGSLDSKDKQYLGYASSPSIQHLLFKQGLLQKKLTTMEETGKESKTQRVVKDQATLPMQTDRDHSQDQQVQFQSILAVDLQDVVRNAEEA